jgi:5'(3')-deoxyribonucleotidase
MRELNQLGAVYVVTSPWWPSPTWMYERTNWLRRHFGVTPEWVVHTSAKKLVHGRVFIDDNYAHLVDWRTANPIDHELALLVDAPYNRAAPLGLERGRVRRTKGWGDVVGEVREWLATR